MERFSELEIPSSIVDSLARMEITIPTPIQAMAIPPALSGKDVIGTAQTGTGKTAAFCIPILTQVMANSELTALVLAPTRELVLQIENFWRSLTEGMKGMHSAPLIGGAPMPPQRRALYKGPCLIVATPGRLIDHLERRTARLGTVGILVLDEADQMLDMGFTPQVEEIMRYLPKKRQTLLFTATMKKTLTKFSAKSLRDPIRVEVETTTKNLPKIKQTLVETPQRKKNDTLLEQVGQRQGSILVFVRTQRRADKVAKNLAKYGVAVDSVHGGRSQGQRKTALYNFRSGKVRVLVGTDVASRGLDISGLGHVINFDLPQTPDDYIHRIGRTGRADAEGEAVSIVVPADRELWQTISKGIEKAGTRAPKFPGAMHEPASKGRTDDRATTEIAKKTHLVPNGKIRPTTGLRLQRKSKKPSTGGGSGDSWSDSKPKKRRGEVSRGRWESKTRISSVTAQGKAETSEGGPKQAARPKKKANGARSFHGASKPKLKGTTGRGKTSRGRTHSGGGAKQA